MNLTYEKLEEFKQFGPDFLDRYCFVNGAPMLLDDLEAIGYSEFAMRAKFHMPTKLYKYCPNVARGNTNYSIEALKSNEVFLSCPADFDDVYDSSIYTDWATFLQKRLQHYCTLCGIQIADSSDIERLLVELLYKLSNAVEQNEGMIAAFNLAGESEGASLAVQVFIGRLTNALLINGQRGQAAVLQALWEEYNELQNRIQRSFRISCFTTTPFSQLMWGGSYANCHSGFCIEYQVLPGDESFRDVYNNLFPVVYSKIRSDISDALMRWQDACITEETLWNIYFHGTLRKSFDWAYQNEWRLLMPADMPGPNYTVPFFPISKVYLGNRMKKETRQEIIEICHAKHIPYIGVTRAPDRFEMQECSVLCEECPQFTGPHMQH